jgi:TonB family protein
MRRPLGLLVLISFGGACVGCASAGSQEEPPASFRDVCGTQPANTVPTITPPRLIHRIDPKISLTDPSPICACVEGVVQTDGSVTDLKVIRTSGADMTTKALAAVREWRYSPATQNGVAITYPIKVGFFIRTRSQ